MKTLLAILILSTAATLATAQTFCGNGTQGNGFLCGGTWTSPFANATGSVTVSNVVASEVNVPAFSTTPTANQVYFVAPSAKTAGFSNWMKFEMVAQSAWVDTAKDNGTYQCNDGDQTIISNVAICDTMFNEPSAGSGGAYLAACTGDLRAIVPSFHINNGTGVSYNAVAVVQKVPGSAPAILGYQEMSALLYAGAAWQLELTYLGGGNARALMVDTNGITKGTAITSAVNTTYVNSGDPIGALFVGSQATNCGATNTAHQIDVFDFQYQ